MGTKNKKFTIAEVLRKIMDEESSEDDGNGTINLETFKVNKVLPESGNISDMFLFDSSGNTSTLDSS